MRVKTYHFDTPRKSQRFNVFCVLDVLLKISDLRHFLCPIRTILFMLKSRIITYFCPIFIRYLAQFMPKFAAPRLRQIGSIKRETSWNVKLVILRLWDRKIIILGMMTADARQTRRSILWRIAPNCLIQSAR